MKGGLIVSLAQQWLKGELDTLPVPRLVIATISAQCNLACGHCYWAHDLRDATSRDWNAAIVQVVAWGSSLTYAGRILNPIGAKFLKRFIEVSGKVKPGIIDNGWTIMRHPDLLKEYEQIAISIDGEPEDHDLQRGKVGAFEKSWETVLELKRQGFDPVVSSALSPISMRHWGAFEERIVQCDIPLSTTLVWSLRETEARGAACLNNRQVVEAFERLISGTPKLINLYATDQVRALAPILKHMRWAAEDDALVAEAPSGAVVIYRPESVLLVSEIDLLWDGEFYTHEFLTNGAKVRYVPSPDLLGRAQVLCKEERKIWEEIL